MSRIVCRLCLSVLCLLVATQGTAFGWHGAGHMATALVAYMDLGPARAKKVADILRKHPDYVRWMQEKPSSIPEDVYLFMRASTWPDDIRSNNHPSNRYHQPKWHYVNGFVKSPPSFPSPRPDSGDHIPQAVVINAKAAGSADAAERARAVCWLFHLIGDGHQPLHSAAFVSQQWPQGDRGGNSFWVVSHEGATNLHNFWDGIWDRETAFNKGAGRKLSALRARDLDMRTIGPLAVAIRNKHPRNGLPEMNSAKDFPAWLAESFSLAKQRAYLNGVLRGGTDEGKAVALPTGYEAEARKVGERRLALGGYRLADTLKAVLRL
jgi:hypothetical protein